jgi:secretion/DNA translocation related CpaE-like protein
VVVDKPLLIAHDPELTDDLDKMAAAVGCGLHVTRDVVAGRAAWATAPLVLLDVGALSDCVVAGLARRRGVFVLCRGEPSPAVWQRAMQLGAEKVLALPDAEPSVVRVLSDAVEGACGDGRVIAVVGGRGGAGASVFAAALALVAAWRGGRVLLVDCDPLGGGLDLLLGVEQADGLRWPDLAVAGDRVPAGALHGALPAVPVPPDDGPLSVLSCRRGGEPPTADAVAAVVESGQRAGDTVVCDLPRHLPKPALAALDRARLVALVVPAEVRACAAAAPVASRLSELGCEIKAVVRGPAPGGLAPADVARALAVPVMTAMRPAPRLAASLDAGRPPLRSMRGPLARAAGEVLDAAGVPR